MRLTPNSRNQNYLVPALLLILSLALGACTSVPPQPAASPVLATATSAAAPATPLPVVPTNTAAPVTPTVAPTATMAAPTAPAPSTDSLVQLVQAGLPAGAFEGVTVLPLTVPAGQPPLWAVYSQGMRNFDLTPLPNHFVAIYAQANGNWQELARQEFSSGDPAVAAPDYVGEGGLAQVQIEPSHTWLALEGGAGAHSGVFELLDFDGRTLRIQVNGFSSSPGVGSIKDVNGDGIPDVILDASDHYVFCYACGVTDVGFQVFAWDQANGRMMERPIEPMLMGQSGHPARDLTNKAVELAQAGLWKDAASVIEQAKQAATNVQPPFTNDTVDWDYGLIKLHAGALADATANSGYPLLSNIFYGDYAAAVDLMRQYSAQQIFSAQTPLVVGTTAEAWVPELSSSITKKADAALALKPDLAPAYFLRGWASYLADPVANRAQAKVDVAKAAALAPADALYRDAAAFLSGGSN
jgi:hypothetical protein